MRMLSSERKPGCLAKGTLWIGRSQRGKCSGIIPSSLLWDRQKNDSELGRHVAAKLSRVEVVVARDEKIKVGARSRQ
jgi:hypothetical protein